MSWNSSSSKQKTAYEILRSDWSSDVCSSDLRRRGPRDGVSSRARAGLRAPGRGLPYDLERAVQRHGVTGEHNGNNGDGRGSPYLDRDENTRHGERGNKVERCGCSPRTRVRGRRGRRRSELAKIVNGSGGRRRGRWRARARFRADWSYSFSGRGQGDETKLVAVFDLSGAAQHDGDLAV